MLMPKVPPGKSLPCANGSRMLGSGFQGITAMPGPARHDAGGALPGGGLKAGTFRRRDGSMKRVGVWLFYLVGALAVGYLALYAYVTFTGRTITPGDPIRIFRKPDAPSYS
jgi:hypothetical protein